MIAFLRALRRGYGVWPVLDHVAHCLHIGGPVRSYLCYRADMAFGMTEEAARS